MKIKTIVLTMCLIVMVIYNAHAQTQTGYRVPAGFDTGWNARVTQQENKQPSGTTSTFVTRYGTVGVNGSTTAGYMIGTDSAFPRSVWTPATRRLNFLDITLQMNSIDIPSSGSITGKIDIIGGTGTGNILTNTQLIDATIPATATINLNGTISVNSATLSPLEVSYIDGLASNAQTQIDTKLTKVGTITTYLGSVTAGGKTGTGSFSLAAASGNITVTSTVTGDGHLAALIDTSGSASVKADIQEDGSTIVAGAAYLDFDGNDFIISDSGGSKARIAKDSKSPLRFTGTTTTPSVGNDTVIYNKLTVTTGAGTDTTSMAQPAQEYGTTASTKLLLHANNAGTTTFTDSSTFAHTIIPTGTVIGSSTARFGSGSAWFDGTASMLTVGTSSAFAFGTGSFRFDASVYFNTILGFNIIYANQSTDKLVFDYKSETSELRAHIGASVPAVTWNPSVKTWYDLSVIRYNGSVSFFIDGAQTGSTQLCTDNISAEISPCIGGDPVDNRWFDGLIDEVRIGSDSVNIQPTVNYNTYNLTVSTPASEDKMLQLINNNGTFSSGLRSFCLVNASTTVFGLGTTTAVIATSTTYSGWFDGAVRATAFNVASTEKIKENIESVKLKPDTLDAEAEAKKYYIASNKDAWIDANKDNYTYVGSGTVMTNFEAMNADYNSYIELEWASDLAQDTLIENVQKQHEVGFWQAFDSIQPKSWNPKENLNLIRKGFVVEEMPDVVKGDDKQSIDPMALIAYLSLVVQSLKADTVLLMQSLQELSSIGTLTTQSIIENRLNILEAK